MAISQLQQLVEGSDLSEQDKNVWLRALEFMDEEQAQDILEVVADDPHELDALTRNLKLKQVAFASADDALLDQILADEKEGISRT